MKTLYSTAFALLVFSRVCTTSAYASDYIATQQNTRSHLCSCPLGRLFEEQARSALYQPVVYYRPSNQYGGYGHNTQRERHYYPFTGKKPKVGRLEGRDMLYLKPKAGKKYEREWTAAPDYTSDYYDDREEEQRTRRQPIYIQPIFRGLR
jgi:hypothetical protein